MYKCLTCKNECEFEEINIIKAFATEYLNAIPKNRCRTRQIYL